MSPDGPSVDVFDLAEESSSENTTPDMDPNILYVKLKEAQCTNAVTVGELTKLKAKVCEKEK